MVWGEERPLIQIFGGNDDYDTLKACYPYPSFPQCKYVAVYFETICIIIGTVLATYKFMTLFFFYVSSHNFATRKAMYFWFFGVILNSFLLVMQMMRATLRESNLASVFGLVLSIIDIWPFLLVISLIMDIFEDTGAFSFFETVASRNLVRLFIVYTIALPICHSIFYSRLEIMQRQAFLLGSYLMIGVFVIFFLYVILRIFICEKYISSFFIGSKVLLRFQIGAFFLTIALILKMVLLVWFEIPPASLDIFMFLINPSKTLGNSVAFFCVTHGLIYVVPYLFVALGANITKSRDSMENTTGSLSSRTSISTVGESLG